MRARATGQHFCSPPLSSLLSGDSILLQGKEFENLSSHPSPVPAARTAISRFFSHAESAKIPAVIGNVATPLRCEGIGLHSGYVFPLEATRPSLGGFRPMIDRRGCRLSGPFRPREADDAPWDYLRETPKRMCSARNRYDPSTRSIIICLKI